MQINFYYKRGGSETHIPWNRPTWSVVFEYFSYIKTNTDILEKYDMYIIGNFLFDMKNTWDLDINITGEYQIKELENDLNILMDIALNKFQLLADIKWVSKLFHSTPLSFNQYINPNYQPQTHYIIEFKKIIKIVNNKEFNLSRINPEIIEDLNENLHKIKLCDKYKDKILDIFAKQPDRVFLQSMHVEEFLTTSKLDFFAKINTE
jgi:hypothetical protein